jgi:hypothetical protein
MSAALPTDTMPPSTTKLSALSSTVSSPDNAESLVVDGGIVSVDSAADIQGVTSYDSGASSYTIEDSSAAILSEQGFGTVVDSGVEQVFVTDTVSVVDGVSLSDMEVALEAERGMESADIDFDVAGSASDIVANASNLSGASIVTVTDIADASQGVALDALEVSLVGDDSQADVLFNVADSASAIAFELSGDNTVLDNAESLVVTGGATDMIGAANIQSSDAYDAAASSYTIADTAGAVLGDTGTAIDDDGVSTINVAGSVNAGVGVQLGALEDASFDTGFSADINFNVIDDASDIATALAGDDTVLHNADTLNVSSTIYRYNATSNN